MRLRATVAYDGTDFHGFQRQANARSVQGVLEEAFGLMCGQPVSVVGAGRTDAGVHASGQVIAFEAGWRHGLDDLQRAVNATLPEDVSVLDLGLADEAFHPRYSARSRVYEYTVVVTAVRRPLVRRYAWQVRQPLDVRRMNEAACRLVGEYDFAAFGTAPKGDVTMRRVVQAEWREVDDRGEFAVLRHAQDDPGERVEADHGEGAEYRASVEPRPPKLVFRIEANAFLFRMARRIVKVLVLAGQGALSADDVGDILASKDPWRVKGLAPACGLCLVKVTY